MRKQVPNLVTPAFRFFVFRDINPFSKTVKLRILGAPTKTCALAQKEVNHRIQQRIRQASEYNPLSILVRVGYGAIKKRSSHQAAHRHVQSHQLFLYDLRGAYQQVTCSQLCEAIRALFSSLEDAIWFAFHEHCEVGIAGLEEILSKWFLEPFELREGLFATEPQGLVQGGNASPALFNLFACHFLDIPITRELEVLAKEILGKSNAKWHHLFVYTRYLDDLVISTKVRLTRQQWYRVRKMVRYQIASVGLQMSYRKCRVVDLHKNGVLIHGLMVNGETGRIALADDATSKLYKELESLTKKYAPTYWKQVDGRMQLVRQCLVANGENWLEPDSIRSGRDRAFIKLYHRVRTRYIVSPSD